MAYCGRRREAAQLREYSVLNCGRHTHVHTFDKRERVPYRYPRLNGDNRSCDTELWCRSLKGNQLCTAFIAPSNLAPFLIPFVKTLLISIRNFLQNGFLIGQVLAEL